MNRSNIIREVKSNNETIDLISNYDMTVFHDDELDDTQVALSHRRSKKIPRWAKSNIFYSLLIDYLNRMFAFS